VHRTAEARITTRHGGDFRALVYTTDVDEGEHLVLAKGDIRADEPTLVRTHLEYLPGDVFGYRERDTRSLLQKAMERIAAEGKGVILYLRRDARGLDLFSEPRGDSARAPSTALGASWLANFREFGIGAQILRDVGVGKIRWLTNRPLRLVSLPGYGLEIVDSVPLTLDDPGLSSAAARVPKLFKVR
jgi:3,4-dihydroxy 2-butanone 4-phosphate synthase/GTP cyclohydrolase II